MYQQRRARFAYWLILPALVLVLLLNLYPLIEGVIVSLQKQNMARPNPESFVWFRHYIRALFEDAEFWATTWRTFVWTAGSVVGAYVLALGIALLLNMEIFGRGLFRALFLIPWVVPDVVTALLWKWVYADEFGIANFLLLKLGLVDSPVLWLSGPDSAMLAVIAVQIWKLYPVMTIVLLASLQGVPKELLEAAQLDGANALQRFRYVTFRFIRPASVVITLLGAIWTFQSFDIVYLLTGGGPADATQILPVMVYVKAFWATDMGYAAAIGMLMLVMLVAISLIQLTAGKAHRNELAED
ncbi:MAG: sugar ABC transporter permease [Alphaproteobacteria bacterium]